MKTMYKANITHRRIEKVDIFKETTFFIWTADTLTKERKDYPGLHCYFPSFAEAKQFLIDYFNDQLLIAESRVKAIKGKLANLKEQKEA